MNIKYLKETLAAAVMLTSLSGCGFLNTTPTPQPAQLKMTAPATGSTLKADEIIAIRGEYSGNAIAEVHLWVNGASDSLLEVRPGDPNLALDWLPKTTGRQILYLEGYDKNRKVLARSDAIVLMVEAPTATPPAELTATPEPTIAALPSPVAMAAAVTTTTAVTATAVTTQVLSTTAIAATTGPSVTITAASVNLRSGPGTTYEPQGQLLQGQTATVVGKSADGTWWQIKVEGKTAWVFGELILANAAASGVPVVQAPPAPTAAPTAEETATAVAIIEFTPLATTTTAVIAEATATAALPAADVCNDANPFWAAKLNNNTDYAFCTPVPFEFVPGGSADPDELVIRWNIFGIKSLELRIDPSGDSCGAGSTGLRQQVPFNENNFRLNRRSFLPGGYKIGLWATLNDGRVQDWGELHFCGKN